VPYLKFYSTNNGQTKGENKFINHIAEFFYILQHSPQKNTAKTAVRAVLLRAFSHFIHGSNFRGTARRTAVNIQLIYFKKEEPAHCMVLSKTRNAPAIKER